MALYRNEGRLVRESAPARTLDAKAHRTLRDIAQALEEAEHNG